MVIRELKRKDADGMLEWMHDTEIQKYFRFDSMSRQLRDVLEFICNAKTQPIDGNSVHFAITDETDEYFGTISLKNFDMISKNAEFAICLRRKAQGRGLAHEATREILRLAFEQYGLEKVYLNVLSENKKAINLYERCGFTCEGIFRKHLLLKGKFKTLKWYSILREEYKKIYQKNNQTRKLYE